MATRASFNPDLAKQGGGGVEAGKYEIKAAKTQNIKTDNRPNQIYLIWDLIQLDANGDRVRDAQDQDLRLSFGAKSLEHYRVATAKSADDPNPAAKDIDASPADVTVDDAGNTVVMLDAEPFNKSTGAMIMLESLRKQGFPVEVLHRAYTPDFVGLKFELATFTPKECNDKFGMRLNSKPIKDEKTGNDVNVTYKVCVKWLNPNYLNGGTAPATTNNADIAASAPAVAANPTELAVELLKVVFEKKKGSSIKSNQAAHGFVTNAYTQHTPKLPPTGLAAVQALIKDKKWVAKTAQTLGAVPKFTDQYDDDGELIPTGEIEVPA